MASAAISLNSNWRLLRYKPLLQSTSALIQTKRLTINRLRRAKPVVTVFAVVVIVIVALVADDGLVLLNTLGHGVALSSTS